MGTLSRTGYLITYTNCPIVWGSKMQSLMALSTTEAELIAMSTTLREVIHLQNLLLELHGCKFLIPFTKPQVVCRTFEDNTACIEVAQSDHKIHPLTKHISVHLFHFHDHVKRGSLPLSMSHQNISSLTFIQNLCPAINTCPYMIKSWGGHPLHLLTTRECEVVVGLLLKCLPTSVPVLPILLRAILYFLQYMQSLPPIIHLFYLTQCFHPCILVSNIQLGLSIYLWYSTRIIYLPMVF